MTQFTKISKLDWVEVIPQNWMLIKPKYFLRRVERTPKENDEIVTCFRDGIVTLRKNKREEGFTHSLQEIGYQRIHQGDLVVHEMDGFEGSIGVSDSTGKCTPVYTVIEPHEKYNVKYFMYLLREMAETRFIESLSKSIRERTTEFRWKVWSDLYFPIPPLKEQNQIANFLDQKTTIINDLIHQAVRKIALLKEQRTSIINKAVIKGLNPKVKMKDSGVRSIGWIPHHWDLTRLKYLVSFNSGYAFKSEDYSPDGVNLIRIGNLYENILDLERAPIYLPDSFINDYQGFIVKKNDILISLTGTLGKKDYGYSIVYDKEFPSMLNQRVGRLKLTCESVLFQFLTYQLLCDMFLNQLFLKPTGTKQGNLSGDDILTNYLPLPNISEQQEIVEFLNIKTSEIDKQVDLENRKIDLLKEYRQSLISEVVTGKIDVRTN